MLRADEPFIRSFLLSLNVLASQKNEATSQVKQRVKNIMRKLLVAAATIVMSSATLAAPASAAPRRIVVVVAEGLNQQVADFGTAYVKTAYGADTDVALDTLKKTGKSATENGDVLTAAQGLLKIAAANGYRTGLVTTDDVSKIASHFYGVDGNFITDINNVPFDVVAGGGRAGFANGVKSFTDAGNSAMLTVESLDQDVKGKVLALQSDSELSYAIDRDIEKEGGLAELATFALQTLNTDEKPFVLVVHDTLMAKALGAKDTPAFLAQLREVDGIIADALGAREENPSDFGVAVIGMNGNVAPRFATELPNERSDAFYIISELPLSYAKAGQTLAGIDDAKLTAFTTETYKGWKLSAENRASLLKGDLNGETAIRTSYEAALKINYEPVASGAISHSVGLDATNGVVAAVGVLVRTRPAAEAPLVPVAAE
jgi:hypothetical protein